MNLEENIVDVLRKRANLSDDAIEKMTKKIIEEYANLLDRSGALVLLAKNYGIDLSAYGEPPSEEKQENITPIKEIKEEIKSLNIIGIISEILPLKTYKKKDNSDGFFFKFKVKDKTGEAVVVAWEPLHSLINLPDFKIGNIVKISNAFPKKDQKDNLELYLSKFSGVELEIKEVYNDLLPSEIPEEEYKQLSSIVDSDKEINLRVRVKDVYPVKTYKKPTGEESQFMKLIVSDSSGEKSLLVFDEKVKEFKEIKVNDIITISKVNARKNKLTPELIELVPSKYSLVSVVVPSNEVQITPSNFAPVVPIEEFKKQPSKGSIKGIYGGKEPQKTVQTKNGALDLVKIKVIDDTSQLIVNFWGEDIKHLENIQEGLEVAIYDIIGKTNTYTKEIEGSFSKSSRITQIE